ncbi:catecholate siderophore receptor Fiu [Allofranklinella schreckenbergeri]|uniref:Catecholate siderophore receptor Fiu n=1 Tax=Allofranklinella schreckenbergeri TaxID=1076744 RepID=A0A3M6Q735_9BURK|nr:catecholate siderophore receptor Fiu [Allofranklinella schreckenbergeri]RMW98975.1 catecholate siderophore receptor Fiu [Allofranklinella schreckenbergeri]
MSYIKSKKHGALHATSAAKTLGTSTAMAIGMLACGSSLAQQQPSPGSDKALPEVQVTGHTAPYKSESSSAKMTAPLVDTPQTVSVIRREVIQEQGARTLQEALRNTPGVTLLLGEGGHSNTKDNIFMRGFDTSGNLFVDGVRSSGSDVRDTFNMEQIEVIKGASGSEFGRGAPSGSVNIATKAPFAQDYSEVRASAGTAHAKRGTVDINRTLSPSTAVRLNAMLQNSGTPGRDHVKNKGFGLAPSIAFGLGTPTRAYADVQLVRQNNRPDGGVPTVGLPGFYNAALAAANITHIQPVNPRNYYGSLSDFSKSQSAQATLRLEHDFSASSTLRNITRLGRTEFDQLLTSTSGIVSDGRGAAAVPRTDPATWRASRSRQVRWQENAIFTNQTSLNTQLHTGAIKHSISTGLELIYEKQTSKGRTGAGTVAQAHLYAPNVHDPITGYNLRWNGQINKGDTRTIALYAFDTMELGPQWQINAGLRAERYSTKTHSVSAPNQQGVQTTTDLKGSDTLVSGKLGLVYKPVEHGTLYASASTSQQPPGGANFTLSANAASVNNPNMDPSRAVNLEVGAKWELLDRRLLVTGALFRTTVRNDLARTVEGEVEQYGKKQVSGVELGLVGQITPQWNVSAGLARMNTKVVQGTATQTGASLNWSPRLSFTGWSTYQFGNGLSIGGGARYMDSVTRSVRNNLNAATTNMLHTPSYWVYDAFLAYEISKNLSVQLNVYNLANKRYVANLNNNGGRYTPGAARSALLSATYKF